MQPTQYKALSAFEHDGLSYEAGKTYELSDEVIANLPLGLVEVVVQKQELPVPQPPQPKPEVKKEKKSWVGNHTVGQEPPERKRHPAIK